MWGLVETTCHLLVAIKLIKNEIRGVQLCVAWGTGLCSPHLSRLLGLPHVVKQFDHLLIDDEDYGHIQAHAAKPGNCPFIKPAGGRQQGEIRLDVIFKKEKTKTKLEKEDISYWRLRSFLFQDLEGTVHCVFVAVSLQTLQTSKTMVFKKITRRQQENH